MSERKETGLDISQRSVFYLPELIDRSDSIVSLRHDYPSLLYTRMLIDDVGFGIMPIHNAERSFRVLLKPGDEKTEQLVVSALARSRYQPWRAGGNLSDSVSDFLEACAQTLMMYGKAVYEIVYLSTPTDNVIVGFEFVYVYPPSIISSKEKLMQYVPREFTRQHDVKQFIELSPQEILMFVPPRHVQKNLDYAMDRLEFLSKRIIGERLLSARTLNKNEDDSKNIFYDVTEHIRAQKLALADAGKGIGWNARGLFQEETLEYYYVYRQIVFARFIAELRDSLLATLNKGLARVGRKMGFSAQIEIQGLQSPKGVDEVLASLKAGNTSFQDLLKLVG